MKKIVTIGFLTLTIIMIMGCTVKNNHTKTITENIQSPNIATNFSKTLSLQGFTFDINTTGEGSIQQLTIQPHGLKVVNDKIDMEIDGFVTDAEITDLDADGYPEIFIYTVSAGSGSYGNVIGYAVNKGKSISAIYFPPVNENPKINQGYMGHDEFAVGELALLQRFKTYNANDKNNVPTGKTRQIQYKLKQGEASWQLAVDKVLEY